MEWSEPLLKKRALRLKHLPIFDSLEKPDKVFITKVVVSINHPSVLMVINFNIVAEKEKQKNLPLLHLWFTLT